MKRQIITIVGGAVLTGLLLTGCSSHRAYRPVVATAPTGEVVVVSEAPPALRREVIGVAPSAQHVWVQGYWTYRSHRWVWMAGHYELRPRAGAAWIPGQWDRTSRGWVWLPGHWD